MHNKISKMPLSIMLEYIISGITDKNLKEAFIMKANSVKTIFEEMNARMCATIGEANYASKLSSLVYSVDENPFLGFHTHAEFFGKSSIMPTEDPSVIFNECKEIRDKIDDTRYGGLVIDFVNKNLKGMGTEYPFGNCLIKISPYEIDIPYYILADEATPFSSRVFIGENCNAYLITQLDNDEIKCVKLSEFHFMSFQSNGKDEYGLFTSWSRFVSKPYFSILKSPSLDPIKCFFLSEWLSSYKKNIIDTKKKGSENNE